MKRFVISMLCFFSIAGFSSPVSFSSDVDIGKKTAEAIRKESVSIRMVTPVLSDDEVIAALVSAAGRGIPVEVIVEEKGIGKGTKLSRLTRAGGEVWIREKTGKDSCLRETFILLGEKTVRVGSYSCSSSKKNGCREYVIHTSEEGVRSAFLKEFETLRGEEVISLFSYLERKKHFRK